jgi:hypothetical protein
MNIFYLSKNAQEAAQFHNDKHVVKMILESAQLLSTAHRVLDGHEVIEKKQVHGSLPARWRNVKRWKLNDNRDGHIYQSTHVNHPSAVWVRQSIDHYRYQYDLMYYLIGEYKYRYEGRDHKCEGLLHWLLNAPENIPIIPWVDPPQAMPDDCKVEGDSVQAYRNYYAKYKRDFAKWTRRGSPVWWS